MAAVTDPKKKYTQEEYLELERKAEFKSEYYRGEIIPIMSGEPVVTYPKKRYSAEEYLEIERKAEIKSEYFKGEIFAMSGASIIHNKITENFKGLLYVNLKGKGCRAYGSDLRLHIPANTLFTYPDISVVCGKEQLLDEKFDTLLNPVFLAEVLSLSTKDYDTGGKFALYRSIESLKEYWTISSFEYRLQKFVKNQANNTWILSEATNPTDSVQLESLGLTVSLNELYEGVTY